jgi:hypothetical protein
MLYINYDTSEKNIHTFMINSILLMYESLQSRDLYQLDVLYELRMQ